MNSGNLSGTGEQLIAAAYVFGVAGLVFATLPFLFMVLRALMKGGENNTSSVDILGVVAFAFVVHFCSCIFFLMLVKIIDLQNLTYGSNYLQDKVFPLFWTEGKDAVLAAAGAGNSSIAEGSYSILYIVQTIRYWSFVLMPIFVLFLGLSYGIYQQKKDTFKQSGDYASTLVWTIGSTILASFLFILWAKIASFALFIPNGEDILTKINNSYNQIFNSVSGGKN